MANVIGPFGFSQWGTASGMPNFMETHNTPYRIAAGNTTAIFYGDLVRYVVGAPTGYLTQWTAGDGATSTQIPVGIFIGCEYYSTSQKKNVWNNYWPGSDATGDVSAYVVDDPNSLWRVQAATGVTVTQTSLGLNADIASTPSGSTVTGISGMALAAPTATSSTTFPFKVVNLITTPPGANGTDLTTAGNYVIVAYNNQLFKSIQSV
jgi:hypothetical protein